MPSKPDHAEHARGAGSKSDPEPQEYRSGFSRSGVRSGAKVLSAVHGGDSRDRGERRRREGADRGYKDVFQPKFKGRIVVVDDSREIVSWAFNVLGIPINDVTDENLAKAKPLVQSWLPLIKVFDSENPKGPLLSGDCDLGVVFSGDAAKLYEQNHKFKFILPVEGASVCRQPVHSDQGRDKAEALKFINYILRPEVSKLISDKFPYTNPNAKARKLLSKEQLSNPASYPEEKHLEVFRDIGPASQKIVTMMTELRGRG